MSSFSVTQYPKYTVFDHLAHKFVTTLEGFNKREIHYLKRYFNFNLDKTNLEEFEYNSLDKGVGEWEHYIFSGLGDNSWSFGDVDFLEKILWYFDFRNENIQTSLTCAFLILTIKLEAYIGSLATKKLLELMI